MQEALGLAQKCSGCGRIKLLKCFPIMEAEDGLPEIISNQCKQCFKEEVLLVDRAMRRRDV